MATLGNTPRPAYVYDTETDTWVPIGVGAHTHDYIPNTLVDAKGDILTATADNTPAKLSIGADGTVLVSDSSTATGLRWSSTPSTSNPVINGAFDIWQRGTTFSNTTTLTYGADRWCGITDGTGTTMQVTRQSVSDTTNLPSIQYCARIARTTTGTNAIYYAQSMETVNSIPFAGKTVTFSFYARKGSGYSATSSALAVAVNTGTGTDQNTLQTVTGFATPISGTATLTTTWQRFTYSGTIAATATEIGFAFTFTPVGTTTTNDYYEITGVQIDVGSVALPFRRSGNTIQGELAACQRYYAKSYAQDTAPATPNVQGYVSLKVASNTIAIAERYGTVFLPVTMRTAPTVTIRPYTTPTNTGRVSNCSGVDLGASTGQALGIGQTQFSVNNGSGSTATTVEIGVIFHYEASAEL